MEEISGFIDDHVEVGIMLVVESGVDGIVTTVGFSIDDEGVG